MFISQIRFGEVIRNINTDRYARVIGLKAMEDNIFVECTGSEIWNPNVCERLTTREKGEGITLFTTMESEAALDREI